MKKWLLSVSALLLLSIAHAEIDKAGMIVGKLALEEDPKGYFVLSDGSFWKVYSFVTRWRGPLEWLTGTELVVPENYKCLPNDWFLGADIEAYPKYGSQPMVDESNASNQEDLKKCTHMLFNRKTGQVLYAVALHPADSLFQVYNDGKNIGYNEGYSYGYSLGYSAGFSSGRATAPAAQ